MGKTRKTSESWIAMVILVMNVAGVYRDRIFSYFFHGMGQITGLIRPISLHIADNLVEKLKTGWKVRMQTQLQYAANL